MKTLPNEGRESGGPTGEPLQESQPGTGDHTRAPWPVPAGDPVLLFGGSFDPVHLGHTALAERARVASVGRDGWLVFVPAARSPHKRTGPEAGDEHRLAMLRLAIAGHQRAAVWEDELTRAGPGEGVAAGTDADADTPASTGPSYWVDTLERAMGARAAARSATRSDAGTTTRDPGGSGLRFLIGADQALAFHRWHRFRRILECAQPVVLLREPYTTPQELTAALADVRTSGGGNRDGNGNGNGDDQPVWTPTELGMWAAAAVSVGTIDASSTAIRAALRVDHGGAHRDVQDQREAQSDPALSSLDPKVLAYIREHALYC